VKCWEKGRAIVELLKRRALAGKGPLGSKDNPIHQRISFIEFGATIPAAAVPGADQPR
jgi:hypothetical protein